MKASLFNTMLIFGLISLIACQKTEKTASSSQADETTVVSKKTSDELQKLDGIGKPKLSDYNLFEGPMRKLQAAAGLQLYELNTPLFTDYAHKKRFMKIPEGKTIRYREKEVLDFPEGTILVKNFYYPADFRKPSEDWTIIETRLLIHEKDQWKALTYVWNEQQSEAFLEIAGATKDVQWLDKNGNPQQLTYSVPNMIQCKSCHVKSNKLQPIGPSARQLNKEVVHNGKTINLLKYLAKNGQLSGLPARENIPRLAVWNDPASGTLDQRARAWLDINCGHCHNPEGPANTSGLFLSIHEKRPYHLGIEKPPVAAGRGTGGRKLDIKTGDADGSILVYRIESTDPGIMMPELGRKKVHHESLELIKEWINQMGEQ